MSLTSFSFFGYLFRTLTWSEIFQFVKIERNYFVRGQCQTRSLMQGKVKKNPHGGCLVTVNYIKRVFHGIFVCSGCMDGDTCRGLGFSKRRGCYELQCRIHPQVDRPYYKLVRAGELNALELLLLTCGPWS